MWVNNVLKVITRRKSGTAGIWTCNLQIQKATPLGHHAMIHRCHDTKIPWYTNAMIHWYPDTLAQWHFETMTQNMISRAKYMSHNSNQTPNLVCQRQWLKRTVEISWKSWKATLSTTSSIKTDNRTIYIHDLTCFSSFCILRPSAILRESTASVSRFTVSCNCKQYLNEE